MFHLIHILKSRFFPTHSLLWFLVLVGISWYIYINNNIKYPEIYLSMKKPQEFNKVLRNSMIIITVMYLSTAIFGYYAYGDETQSPIMLNLPPGFISHLSMFLITLHVLLACPILLNSFSLDIERRFVISSTLSRITFRSVIIICLVLISISIPYFSDFMSLLGAVSSSSLMLIIPVAFDWKLFGFYHPNYGQRSIANFLCGIFVICLGFYICFVGGMSALTALYKDVVG